MGKSNTTEIILKTIIKKPSAMWKGISSLVKINPPNKTDITIIDTKGEIIADPKKIVNSFNHFFVNIGPDVDKKIPASRINYMSYPDIIKTNQSFFLRPARIEEIQEIICAFNINKSLGLNSSPIYILKLCGHFFSECMIKIANLSFTTGIFPEFCKIAKVIAIFKKDDPLLRVNYRPISTLPMFSKIIEKILYLIMYSFLEKK